MKTIADINKEIQVERERAALKVAELQEQQKDNRNLLEKANERYMSALATSADDAEISSFHDEVESIKRTITLTDDTIRALSGNNPRIQALQAERITLLLELKKEAEQKATALFDKLKPHHETLKKGLEEMRDLYKLVGRYISSIDSGNKELSKVQQEQLGVQPYSIYRENLVPKLMSDLLIERGSTFRVFDS